MYDAEVCKRYCQRMTDARIDRALSIRRLQTMGFCQELLRRAIAGQGMTWTGGRGDVC